MLQAIATIELALILPIAVIALTNKPFREKIARWFEMEKNRLWLVPLGILAYYALITKVSNHWDTKTFACLCVYFVAPTVLFRFTKPENKLNFAEVGALFLLCILEETNFVPRHWSNIFASGNFSFPGTGGCGVVYVFLLYRRIKKIDLKCDWSMNRADLKFVGLGLLAVSATILPIAIKIHFLKPTLENLAPPHYSYFLASFLAIFLGTALAEELFYRGLIQNLLMTRFSTGWSIACTAIIFGFSHLNNTVNTSIRHFGYPNWWYVFFGTIAGAIYGYVYHKRSMPASMLLHTLVDWSRAVCLKG